MKGVMIDCSRVCEKPAYYHHLVDLLADWGQDTLALHFCDDQGFGVVLPGFEPAAHPWALGRETVRALLDHARRRGVRVIPEIEPFGHTLWVTRLPGCEACYLGDPRPGTLRFSAVDPRRPGTLRLMERLVDGVCALFDDPVVHVGCDEVDLGDFCRRHRLDDPAAVWAGYVNTLFARVRDRGRRPMFWADHAERDPAIRRRLDKDAIAVAWHYQPHDGDRGLRALGEAGFAERVAAPSASCWRTRCHTHRDNCDNLRRQARFAAAHGAGYLNTVWCPMRHIQGAVDHGICFGALMADSGGALDGEALDAALAERLFGSEDPRVRRFCRELPLVQFDHAMSEILLRGRRDGPECAGETRALAEHSVAAGEALLRAVDGVTVPSAHGRRWQDCLLAARTALHCARCVLDGDWARRPERMAERRQLIAEVSADWDRTRFPEDPAKRRPQWGGHESGYLLHLLEATLPEGAE